jgi:hypothetical protein
MPSLHFTRLIRWRAVHLAQPGRTGDSHDPFLMVSVDTYHIDNPSHPLVRFFASALVQL